MIMIYEIYNEAVNIGKDFNIPSSDIRVLLSHIEGFKEPIDVLYYRDNEVQYPDEFWYKFEDLKKGKPVEYVINEAQFFDKMLYVDERVLIPRRETSELVALISQKISSYFDPRNYLVVADIGTGSGAIALALKSLFHNWLITASDISKEALEIAKMNFDKYSARINVLEGDSLKPYIDANMALDIIVSTPPYILNKGDVQPSVMDFEPHEALFLDKNDSVYEKIFKDVYKVKKGSLLMCFEIGYDLQKYLEDLMKKYLHDFEYEFMNDLDDRLRFLFIYLR